MVNLRDVLNAFAATLGRNPAGGSRSGPNGASAPTMPFARRPYPGYSAEQTPDLLANLARLSRNGDAGATSPLAEAAQSTQQQLADRLRAYQQATGQFSADAAGIPMGSPYADASMDPRATDSGLPEDLLQALYAAQERARTQDQTSPYAIALPALPVSSPPLPGGNLPVVPLSPSRKRQAVPRRSGSSRR